MNQSVIRICPTMPNQPVMTSPSCCGGLEGPRLWRSAPPSLQRVWAGSASTLRMVCRRASSLQGCGRGPAAFRGCGEVPPACRHGLNPKCGRVGEGQQLSHADCCPTVSNIKSPNTSDMISNSGSSTSSTALSFRILRRNLGGGLEDDAPTPGQAILDYAAEDDVESGAASPGAVPCQPGAKGNKEAVARMYGYASEQQCDRC